MLNLSKIYIYTSLLLVTISVVVSLNPIKVNAQTGSGDIRGVVTDNESGEPLPGVNVVVQGTDQGAATDSEGRFVIINVPVGTYNVQASMIGYANVVKTGVLVTIDQVARVSFNLQTQALAGEEVTVVAERAIIHKEVSSSQQVITAEQLTEAPSIRTVQDFLSKQAGVSGDLGIRGGALDQTGTVVNGVAFTNDKLGKPDAGIPLSAIEQVSVVSGGFTAEHGNYRSGLINISTKSGNRDRYHGRIDVSRTVKGQKRFGPSIFDPYNHTLRHKFDPEVAFTGTATGWVDNAFLRGQYKSWPGWESVAQTLNNQGTFTMEAEAIDAYLADAWVHGIVPPFDKLAEMGYDVPDSVQQRMKDHARVLESENWDYNVDFGFGGLVPIIGGLLGDATFFLSHKTDREAYYKPEVERYQSTATSMLTVQSNLAENMKLTLNGLYRDRRGMSPNGSWSGSAFGDMIEIDNIGGDRYNYQVEYRTPWDRYTNLINLDFQHTLSEQTFWNLNVSRQERFDRVVQPWAKEGISWQDYTERGYNNRENVIQDPEISGGTRWVVDPPVMLFGPIPVSNQPYGNSSAYTYVQGPYGAWDYGLVGYPPGDTEQRFDATGQGWFDSTEVQQFKLRSNITSQVSFHHQLRAGIDLSYDIYNHANFSRNYQITHENRVYKWTVERISAGAYFQDRLEYEGLVANLGVRLDYYDSGGEWPSDSVRFDGDVYGGGDQRELMFDRWGQMGVLEDVRTHFTVSPRVGLSFPVTVNSKFFFNYGHFRSLVPWENQYEIDYNPVRRIRDMGNPNLEPPRTIAYETGVEYNLLNQFLIRVSGYYKDITGQAGRIYFENNLGTADYGSWANNNYQDIYGAEISVQKTFGQWITGWVNYDYRLSKDGLVGREDFFEDPSKNAVQGLYEGQESRPIPRPVFNANVTIHTPMDFGPTAGGFNPLGGWSLSVLPSWRAGYTFTWNPLGKLHVQDNMRSKPDFIFDAKMTKRLRMAGMNFVGYIDVRNLFNQTGPLSGNAFSSGADREDYLRTLHLPLYDSPEFDELRAASPEGWYVAGDDKFGDLRSDDKPYINDPNVKMFSYRQPRRQIWFGVRLEF